MKHRDLEEEFYREKEAWNPSGDHIAKHENDPVLARIDALYSAADAFSIRYAEIYRRILLVLSISGTLLALAFLLYDEVYWYGMIIACGILIMMLFIMNHTAHWLSCHRKYLEYRLLAEGMRVQFFLRKAGLNHSVADLLPWAWQWGVPWTKHVLQTEFQASQEPAEKSPVLDIWIRDQKNYHLSALSKTEQRVRRNENIVRLALILAILTYLLALIFEIVWGGLFTGSETLAPGAMELVRTILKVSMGTFSAMTIFAGNYYGKLSLEDTAQDHRRMAALYERAEHEIMEHGETDALLLQLAREELSENSRWYAYQSKNSPGMVI